MNLIIKSDGEHKTRIAGNCLGRCLTPGTTVLLCGDLGAGKTTFTKALAEGVGIDPRHVTSPTFSILHHFPEGKIPLVHVDLYRLGENPDLDEIGIDEYLDGHHIMVVEWSEYLRDESPLKYKSILIRLTFESETVRLLEFTFPDELLNVKACLKKCLEEQGIEYESVGA